MTKKPIRHISEATFFYDESYDKAEKNIIE